MDCHSLIQSDLRKTALLEFLISVRVTPRAKRERIEIRDGVLRVFISAAPVDGQANDAVVKVLSKSIGVAKSSIAIVRGEKSREKTVRISGLDESEIMSRLNL